MKDRDKDIYVNTKHRTLRTVAFIIALAVAVTAFTMGILSIGHKDEGYQTVTAETDNEAVAYTDGVVFKYYMTGRSGAIKSQLKELTTVYSGVMKRAYKFLDAVNEYQGYSNLATINTAVSGGSSGDIAVSPELYDILKRAYEYTLEGRGYNMFAGELYAYWNSILSLDEPEAFDPAADADEAQRLERLTKATSDLTNFNLEFVDDTQCIVRLSVSRDYLALLDDLEVPVNMTDGSYMILDLNLLRDAFLMEWVANELNSRQYTDGYLESSSGLMVSLAGHERGEYCEYDFSEAVPVTAGTVPACGNMAVSHFCNVPVGDKELGKYTFTSGESIIRRSGFVNAVKGCASEIIANSYVISTEGNPAEAVYRNIIMSGAESEEGLREIIGTFDGQGPLMTYEYFLAK